LAHTDISLSELEILKKQIAELEDANMMRAQEIAELRRDLIQMFDAGAEKLRLSERRANVVDELFAIMQSTPIISFREAAKRLGCSKTYLRKLKPLILSDNRFELVLMPNKHKQAQFLKLRSYTGRNRETQSLSSIPEKTQDDLLGAEADSILNQLDGAEKGASPKTIGIWSKKQTGHMSGSGLFLE